MCWLKIKTWSLLELYSNTNQPHRPVKELYRRFVLLAEQVDFCCCCGDLCAPSNPRLPADQDSLTVQVNRAYLLVKVTKVQNSTADFPQWVSPVTVEIPLQLNDLNLKFHWNLIQVWLSNNLWSFLLQGEQLSRTTHATSSKLNILFFKA